MNVEIFNHLSLDQKARFTWDNTTFITSVKVGSKNYSLFELPDFYIEMEYDSKTNCIVTIQAFKCIKEFERYLQIKPIEKLFREE